ncbi:MAG: carboxypeptidase-like regulatory domain-containing protein, partial [Clostridia bacterium]
NGSGITGATVQVTETGSSVLTGTDGSYQMDGIPAGQWNVAVSADGYVSLTKAVTVEKDTVSSLDFQLAVTPEYTGSDMHVASISFTEKRFGLKFIDLTVLVKVVSSEDGLPLAEARMEMTLTYEGGSWQFTGLTNTNGTCTFVSKKVSPGTYEATVTILDHMLYIWDDSQGVTSGVYIVQ